MTDQEIQQAKIAAVLDQTPFDADMLHARCVQILDTILESDHAHRPLGDQFLTMLLTQYSLNIEAAGARWVERSTKPGQKLDMAAEIMPLDYGYAAFSESASELAASAVPYEWWRDPKRHVVDVDNSKVELIDITHFLLSQTIVFCIEDNDDNAIVVTEEYLGNHKNFSLHVVAMGIVQAALTMVRMKGAAQVDNDKTSAKTQSFQAMMELREQVKWLSSHLIHNRTGAAWTSMWRTLHQLGVFAGQPDLDKEFVLIYNAKVALNSFRYANGYKTGTYKKVWSDGREDNAHLMDIAATAAVTGRTPTRADFYEWLSVNYPNQLKLLAQDEESNL